MSDAERLIEDAAKIPIAGKKMPRLIRNGKTAQRLINEGKLSAANVVTEAHENAKMVAKRVVKGSESLVKARKSQAPPQAVYEAFKNFEDALGGRGALIEILQHCPDNSVGFTSACKLMSDPDFIQGGKGAVNGNVKYSLSVLCARYRIPLNALVSGFRDAQAAKVAVESLVSLHKHTPQVITQLAAAAQDTFHECPVCEGSGRIWRITSDGEWELDAETHEHKTQLCHRCRGQGKEFKEHDVQNRKMFLQVTGILDSKPLVQQTFNQQANVFKGDFLPGDGSLEHMLSQVDAIDVEIIKEEAEIPLAVYEPIEEIPEGETT